MSKKSFSREEKYEILMTYYKGDLATGEIAKQYKVHTHAIYDWLYKYEELGIDGLKESEGWKRYSKELKSAAVTDYLSGNYSHREVTRKYGISDKSVLKKWIKLYNGHREWKATGKGMSQSMTKGRSTTVKERIKMARDCLAHGKDYQRSMELYKVSYQQVYQWVKKYEEGGDQALQDMRGKRKTEEELTPEQKGKREIKKLEQENERLRAENAFLKKIEEIERRRF